jgi:hypothetical protein
MLALDDKWGTYRYTVTTVHLPFLWKPLQREEFQNIFLKGTGRNMCEEARTLSIHEHT